MSSGPPPPATFSRGRSTLAPSTPNPAPPEGACVLDLYYGAGLGWERLLYLAGMAGRNGVARMLLCFCRI
ncbi:hypothetical protein BDZ89DRAFT_697162 [Hymenopellis radicata]|nr:hypothetical protein BDZ89DRAFT_697162 [Hymenopellis radicata]